MLVCEVDLLIPHEIQALNTGQEPLSILKLTLMHDPNHSFLYNRPETILCCSEELRNVLKLYFDLSL